jgi:hypothetical protein
VAHPYHRIFAAAAQKRGKPRLVEMENGLRGEEEV